MKLDNKSKIASLALLAIITCSTTVLVYNLEDGSSQEVYQGDFQYLYQYNGTETVLYLSYIEDSLDVMCANLHYTQDGNLVEMNWKVNRDSRIINQSQSFFADGNHDPFISNGDYMRPGHYFPISLPDTDVLVKVFERETITIENIGSIESWRCEELNSTGYAWYSIDQYNLLKLAIITIEDGVQKNLSLTLMSSSRDLNDDDALPPIITTTYPACISDSESGFYSWNISDQTGYYYDISVFEDGVLIAFFEPFGTHQIPNSLGYHEYYVYAEDNDDEWFGDRLSSNKSNIVYVYDDDVTGPEITFEIMDISLHQGRTIGISFSLSANDQDSGLDSDSINISINRIEYHEFGTFFSEITIGENISISILVNNNDSDRGEVDKESSSGVFHINGAEIIDLIIIKEFNQLRDAINQSDDSSWRHPGSNRKSSMMDKFDELNCMITSGYYSDAYGLLLHDIKPKLTGLKTNENEIPWGNGVFNNPWVIIPYLQESFRRMSNDLLLALSQMFGDV